MTRGRHVTLDASTLDWKSSRYATYAVLGFESETPTKVVIARYEPGTEVPVHSHGTQYVSVVIDGEISIEGRANTPGDVRIVDAKTAYGPLVAGPAGCTVVEVFADGDRVHRTDRSYRL